MIGIATVLDGWTPPSPVEIMVVGRRSSRWDLIFERRESTCLSELGNMQEKVTKIEVRVMVTVSIAFVRLGICRIGTVPPRKRCNNYCARCRHGGFPSLSFKVRGQSTGRIEDLLLFISDVNGRRLERRIVCSSGDLLHSTPHSSLFLSFTRFESSPCRKISSNSYSLGTCFDNMGPFSFPRGG